MRVKFTWNFVALLTVLTNVLVAQTQQSKKINTLLDEGYKKLEVIPNATVDDGTFVRRAYINIIGRIPTMQEAKAFLDAKKPNKRHELIDTLVDSDGFKSKMFLFYSELLRLKSNNDQHGAGFHQFIHESAQTNKPFDKMVYEMLSAEGHVAENPAVGYYLRDPGMTLDNVSNTVQVFLGTQIGCAQCHDHPFEDTTQMDYYKLAAFSGGFDFKKNPEIQAKVKGITKLALKADDVDVKSLIEAHKKKFNKGKTNKNQSPKEKVLRKYRRESSVVFRQYRRNQYHDDKWKRLRLPHDYQYNDGEPGDLVKPEVLFGEMPELKDNSQRREVFAEWVTSPKNPQFTKVLANRLWVDAFGYGLVEPLDNWTDRTKVSHKPVLDFLTEELKRNKYNVKETLRHIYHAILFQRTVYPVKIEGGKTFHFAGPLLRRMSGEEIHDSFMTLEAGVIDGKLNKERMSAWKKHVENYKVVQKMSSEELYKMNSMIVASEKAAVDIRREAQKLKAEANKAKLKGDDERYKEIMSKVYKKNREAIAQSKQTMMSMGMQSMTMSGGESAKGVIKFATTRNLRFPKTRGYYRASEKQQPFDPSSLVREFGATDGEVSNNSSDHGSITQALAMLNGKEIMSVTDGKGKLAAALKNAGSAEKRLEILFLSLYSRYPNEAEVKNYSKFTQKYHQIYPLAKAMINSKSFLFVQ